MRFYKDADNTGAHTGSLWSSTGTLLASGTFSGETRVGLAGAGLLQPGGGHGGDDVCGVVPHQYRALRDHLEGLASAVTNGPLTALASGGVYAYGSGERLPVQHLQRLQLLG